MFKEMSQITTLSGIRQFVVTLFGNDKKFVYYYSFENKINVFELPMPI